LLWLLAYRLMANSRGIWPSILDRHRCSLGAFLMHCRSSSSSSSSGGSGGIRRRRCNCTIAIRREPATCALHTLLLHLRFHVRHLSLVRLPSYIATWRPTIPGAVVGRSILASAPGNASSTLLVQRRHVTVPGTFPARVSADAASSTGSPRSTPPRVTSTATQGRANAAISSWWWWRRWWKVKVACAVTQTISSVLVRRRRRRRRSRRGCTATTTTTTTTTTTL